MTTTDKAGASAAPETSNPGVTGATGPYTGSHAVDLPPHPRIWWDGKDFQFLEASSRPAGRPDLWPTDVAPSPSVELHAALTAAATPASPAADAVLESIARWVDAMRGQDWSVYPEQYGAGKSRAVEEIAQLLLPAATPTPPVDVAARLRAVVKILDGSEPYVGRGREILALSRMADCIEADPDDAESQAIAQALAGEATP